MGVELALLGQMQPRGDLENEWVMFDHVKRIKDWTTIGIRVYDPKYRKVMTIAVCDMQSESYDEQQRLWLSMIDILEKHGVQNANFKGFMYDNAHANFSAVKTMFGSGIPLEPMENRERTYQFHWRMFLERHTKQLIKSDLQSNHMHFCQDY